MREGGGEHHRVAAAAIDAGLRSPLGVGGSVTSDAGRFARAPGASGARMFARHGLFASRSSAFLLARS